MSDHGQTEAAPQRPVEAQRSVEPQPAVELAAATAEKLQSDVYKSPSNDNSRFDYNQAVISATFAPGSPDSMRNPSEVDFKSYRSMMDSLWLGANKMPGIEREARFAGVGMLPMPDDRGLVCQTAGPTGSQCSYKANERKDGLSKLTRNRQDGTYFFRQGRDTVGKVIPKYAPNSDGNNENGYIRGVERDVRQWSRESTHAPERAGNPTEAGQRPSQESERSREGQRQTREIRRPDDRDRPVVEVKSGESIQAAIDKAQEGSIVKVAPGVYKERLNIKKDNISLRGYGKAVIDLEGQNTPGAAISISDRKNVNIYGFEIRNVRGGETPAAVRIDGASRDISITNNNIHHIESDKNAHGIAVLGTASTPMRNIIIAGNDVHHLKLGASESIAVNGNVDGFRVMNNKVHDNDNIGIDIIGHEGVGRAGIDRARNGIISGNHVYNIDSKSNPAYKGERSAAGIYVDGGSDIVIENNKVQNSNYGIELASEHAGKNSTRIQVRRNTVEGSHLSGISLGGGSTSNGGVTDSIIENNDFRNNTRPFWRQNNVGSDIVYRNNDGPQGDNSCSNALASARSLDANPSSNAL